MSNTWIESTKAWVQSQEFRNKVDKRRIENLKTEIEENKELLRLEERELELKEKMLSEVKESLENEIEPKRCPKDGPIQVDEPIMSFK